VLSSNEVKETLGLSSLQAGRLFNRQLKLQRIQKLQRGLYLVPAHLPPGKHWLPSPYETLSVYMNCLKATWQITGYAAFTRYGFSTQIVQRITVYNDKLSGEVEAGGSRFVFIKLPTNKLGYTKTFKLEDNITVIYSSRARTFFDAVTEAKRFAILPEAYGWLLYLHKNPAEIVALKKLCLILGNRQTVARIGFVLEKLGIDASALLPRIGKAKTLVSLAPGLSNSRQGIICKKWRIIENVSLDKIFAAVEVPDEDE
jgi:predicted transcriptional regulator of viral defense system